MKIIKSERLTTGLILKRLIQEKKQLSGEKCSQEIISEDLGVSVQTFSKWVQDKREIRQSNLSKLASYFDVDEDYLMCRQVEKRKTHSSKAIQQNAEVLKCQVQRIESVDAILSQMGYSISHYSADDGQEPDTIQFIENGRLVTAEVPISGNGEPRVEIVKPDNSVIDMPEEQLEAIVDDVRQYFSFKINQIHPAQKGAPDNGKH